MKILLILNFFSVESAINFARASESGEASPLGLRESPLRASEKMTCFNILKNKIDAIEKGCLTVPLFNERYKKKIKNGLHGKGSYRFSYLNSSKLNLVPNG